MTRVEGRQEAGLKDKLRIGLEAGFLAELGRKRKER